jgi:putative transposase
MIAPNAALSINRQCMLLGIARSSFYYQPRPPSTTELDLLNRLDRIFTEHPVYGSRRLQVTLVAREFPSGAGASDG